jgi:hypothetical protein
MLRMLWQWPKLRSVTTRVYTFEHCLAAAVYPDAAPLETTLNGLAREGTSLTGDQIQQLAATVISQGQAELLDSRFGKDLNEASRERLLTLIETDPYIFHKAKFSCS